MVISLVLEETISKIKEDKDFQGLSKKVLYLLNKKNSNGIYTISYAQQKVYDWFQQYSSDTEEIVLKHIKERINYLAWYASKHDKKNNGKSKNSDFDNWISAENCIAQLIAR